MEVPGQEEAAAWVPEHRYERELVERMLAPSLRYHAQRMARQGYMEPPPVGLWPVDAAWLVGVWRGMLDSPRQRLALAAAWWQQEAGDRATLGRYLHLAGYWQPAQPVSIAARAATVTATTKPQRTERPSAAPAPALWAS